MSFVWPNIPSFMRLIWSLHVNKPNLLPLFLSITFQFSASYSVRIFTFFTLLQNQISKLLNAYLLLFWLSTFRNSESPGFTQSTSQVSSLAHSRCCCTSEKVSPFQKLPSSCLLPFNSFRSKISEGLNPFQHIWLQCYTGIVFFCSSWLHYWFSASLYGFQEIQFMKKKMREDPSITRVRPHKREHPLTYRYRC